MMFELIKGLGIVYYWTWFLWPFVFVSSLVDAISLKIKDKDESTYRRSIIIASISLLIILAGVVTPNLH